MKNQIPFPFLGIKNYKLIKENVFDFSEITFLIGPNNCGKSSVLKALQLLRDNFCDPDFKTRNFSKLKFDSKPMSGTYKSCLNSETNDEKMSFMFPCFLYEESLGINMVYDFSIMDEKGYLSTFSVFQEQSQDNFQSIFQINEDFHPEDGYFLRANINYNYFRSKLIEEHKRQIEKYNEIPEPGKG
ncbi:MAG: ATP-binding protein [Bacteroidetes bacterium]|nr:ATP-binding protein [Bacteroidota bacterium]